MYKNKTEFVKKHSPRKLGLVEYCLGLERQGLDDRQIQAKMIMDNVSRSPRSVQDNDYSNIHPLRKSINRYRRTKMSQTTWNKIKATFLRQVENDWVVSGGSMLDDYLSMGGNSWIEKISKDMDTKREWYGI